MYKKNYLTKIVGISYITIILFGVFSVNFAETNLIVVGDASATLSKFLENEFLFRVGVASSILMYALVIVLAWALFEILSPVNRRFALLGLVFRLTEAILGCAVVIVSAMLPLLLIQSENIQEPITSGFFDLFLKIRVVGLDMVLVFVGLGAGLFCVLLYRFRYVPRSLAGWGILTYFSMLLLGLAGLLFPTIPESTKMLFYAPGGLFELAIGLWFLIKGIRIEGQPASKFI